MSEIRLYFLSRCDEIGALKESFINLFQVSDENVISKETIIPNICVIHVSQLGEEVVKSVRNLNVKAINSETADKFLDFKKESKELKELLRRLKNIDKSENFDFLLQLLISEPEGFSWLK
jgi:hypothetical protein